MQRGYEPDSGSGTENIGRTNGTEAPADLSGLFHITWLI